MNPGRVLVTGATGLLGSTAAAELLGGGAEVLAPGPLGRERPAPAARTRAAAHPRGRHHPYRRLRRRTARRRRDRPYRRLLPGVLPARRERRRVVAEADGLDLGTAVGVDGGPPAEPLGGQVGGLGAGGGDALLLYRPPSGRGVGEG